MADLSISSGSICRPYRSPWGAFPTRSMQCSTGVSSAAILTGRRVTLDWTGSTTAGKVKASTAENTFFLVGIAAQTVQGSTAVTNSEISVWEANPLVEFRAITKGATLASSHIGLRKKVMYDSTLGIEYIDLTASTAADWRAVITGLIDNEGDSGGAVSFRFLSRLEGNIGSSIALTSTSPVLAFYA